MSSSICLRRLPRIHGDILTSSTPCSPHVRAAFSTSASLSAGPKKGSDRTGPPKRGTKALNLSKHKTIKVDTGKRPAPGERKALRKRIVLSNTNALDVPGLEVLDAGNIASEAVRGQVLKLPDAVIDSLRIVEAFKTTQGWNFFRTPSVLMRTESIELGKQIEDAQTSRKTIRKVIAGDRGSGKSTLVLQALAMAMLKGWVVINIPDAKDVTIGHTEYEPLPNSDPTKYIQKSYMAHVLDQTARVNSRVLSKLTLSKKHDLPVPVPADIPLHRFAELGATNKELAWPVFQAFWAELSQPSKEGPLSRPPVLLALDNVGYAMRDSRYRSADFEPIHAHDLALVQHFVEQLSGGTNLQNGGMILCATSGSGRPATPAMDFAIALRSAQQDGLPDEKLPYWSPYKRIDERVLDALKEVEVLSLKGLSREEARSIMEYYAASGMLRRTVNEGLVGEKWTLSGGGIIGELEKNSVRLRI